MMPGDSDRLWAMYGQIPSKVLPPCKERDAVATASRSLHGYVCILGVVYPGRIWFMDRLLAGFSKGSGATAMLRGVCSCVSDEYCLKGKP